MKKKPGFEYYVHLLLACCAVMGVIGIIIQLIRFGTLVESGGIGPTGF